MLNPNPIMPPVANILFVAALVAWVAIVAVGIYRLLRGSRSRSTEENLVWVLLILALPLLGTLLLFLVDHSNQRKKSLSLH